MNVRLRVSLTTWLTLLVCGAVVPLVLLAWVTLRQISRDSQRFQEQGQADTTRALALAVDGEVRSWRAALTTLAASQSLRPGRLAEFDAEARQVAAEYEGWIVLNDATGQQRLNTLLPFGAPLPKTAAREMVEAVFQERKPVTDMVFGAVAQRHIISNSVPVFRDGRVVFCLSLNFGPERLTRLLQRQQFPASWVAAINDRQRRVVARSVLADTRIGKPVVEWFAAATRAAESGIVTGPLIDGRPARVAFQRLQEVPWVVALAIPTAELQSPATTQRFLLVGVILGLAAVGAAVYAGRKITAPVAHLAQVSERMLRGEIVDLGTPSGIREVQGMQHALGEAAAAVRAYYREQERTAVAMERAKVAAASEQALRESEARFRTIFEESPIGKALTGTDGRFLAVNRSLSAMLGYSQAELTSTTSAAIFHPGDLDSRRESLKCLVAGEQETSRTEERYIHRDGHTIWADVSTCLLRDQDGRPLYFITQIQDITERKRAEEEIRSLAKFPAENPRPVLRLDQDGIILYANETSAALLRQWGCSVGSRAPDPWPDTIREVLARQSSRSIDLTCGNIIYSLFVAPFPDAGYVNLYAADITHRKQAEEKLRQTLAELERSNQELERFAYVASHDLQEPLRMVSSYTQLLAQRYRDRLDQDAKQFIAFAVDGATRMQRLIQDLLTYSRVATRGAGLAPTDAQAALREALTNLQTAMHDAGAVVTHDALPMVLADAPQLVQVFQNLVGNAIKFHGDAPPRVHVSATLHGDDWVFAVTDNGIGIAPQYFDRIFVIFQRLHPAHRYAGTGIGLALCQRIVQRHGGRLWVESTPGQGATFYFTLKRQEGLRP